MEHEEMIEVVEELNETIPFELWDNGIEYDYSTNGDVQIIRFCSFVVYCSEEHLEDEIEEAGGLKEFVIQEKNRYINMISKTG